MSRGSVVLGAMPRGPKPRPVQVPLLERARLSELANSQQAPFVVVRRAKMISLLAEGVGPIEVARQLGCSERNVRKWRSRWEGAPCIETLRDRERSGRPAGIGPQARCHVIQLACDRPDKLLTPFRETWTQQALADALRLRTGISISRSSVQRILSAEGLRPHKVRMWLHSPDPDFCEKVERVCDLYCDPPDDAVVLCIDEKPMQALERRFATAVGADAVLRRDFEYRRRGVCHLLGAFDIRTGEVIGQVVHRRTGEALVGFLDAIAKRYRRRRVIVIWDNLNIHHDGRDLRWTRFNERHGGRFEFVHTPMHASWVNQIELWFSILERRVLRHGSFDHLGILRREVEAFIRYWNSCEKKPFRWTFNGRFEHTRRRAA